MHVRNAHHTGAALFVGIGVSLRNGGPASLFIAMCMWVFVVYMVALAQAEMVSLLSVPLSPHAPT